MISSLRATAIIGAGSVVSLVASVVMAKALAVLVGPEGVGLVGVLQSLLGMTVLVAGVGVSTSVVRAIAEAAARGDDDETVALRQAALVVVATTGLIAALLLILLSDPIAGWMLGGTRPVDIALVGIAVPLTLLAAAEWGVLNGHHRIGALTLGTAATSAIVAALTVGIVAAFGIDGIAPAVAVGAGASFAIAFATRAWQLGAKARAVAADRWPTLMRDLVRFGGPYTASALVGTGAQLAIPLIVLAQLGQEAVGLYRAAATIAVGYVAFLLAGFARDYFPRIAAAPADDLRVLAERRTRLVMALATPLILLTLAVAPFVVEVLYTDAFSAAADVLEWQLIGDLLKLPSWALAFVVLARGSSGRFFVLELIGGAILILGVLVGISVAGLVGAGIGYLVSYAAYYIGAWVIVQRYVRLRPGRLQVGILVLVAVLVIMMIVVPEDVRVARSVALAAAAVAIAAVAWPKLWQHQRAGVL